MADYEKFIAGEPGKTNWPDFGTRPPRPDQVLWCVDKDGTTRYQGKKGPARELARAIGGTLRQHVLTEDEHQDATRARRDRLWEEIIYKPTPVHNIRR